MLVNISLLNSAFVLASVVFIVLNLLASKAFAAISGACAAGVKKPVLKEPVSAFRKASNFSSDKTLDIFAFRLFRFFGF